MGSIWPKITKPYVTALEGFRNILESWGIIVRHYSY